MCPTGRYDGLLDDRAAHQAGLPVASIRAMEHLKIAALSVGVLVVNQTAQVVQLASTAHSSLGTATLWVLVGVYAAAAIVRLKVLAPYALMELVLPGGSVMALLLWLYRRRKDGAGLGGSISISE